MAGLITMCILSHKSRSVMIHLLTLIGRGKEGIQLLFKGFRSSCQFHQGLDVMRNIPKVLPSISFGKRMPTVSTVLIRVERFDPFSLVILGLEELRFRMEKVPIIFGAFVESLIIGILVQFCSQLGNTPVIKSLFQSDGDRLGLNVFGHKSVFLPYLKRRVGV